MPLLFIRLMLTFAAAHRVVGGHRLVRGGLFKGWLPDLLLGKLLWRKTLDVVDAGRTGAGYARTTVEGCKLALVYYNFK